ncbi:virulence factor TspB C-terminal domain-related protein [Polaromonas sp.]|uniref:virulence factor TspB C-terminal domain-related protein n=1 Tax=Polaromonas sp. TaxID=1869339 RepID=UPI003CC3D871
MYEFRTAGLRGLLCVLLWLVAAAPLTAHASFPATQTNAGACTVEPCYTYRVTSFNGASTTGEQHPTRLLACMAAIAAYNASPAPGYEARNPRLTADQHCQGDIHKTSDGTYISSPTATILLTPAPPATPVYACPSSSTLSGSTCTCTPPAVQNAANNGCEAPQECAWAAGLSMLVEGSVVLPKSNPTLCMQGCVFTATGGANGGIYWKAADTEASPYLGEYAITGLVGSATVCTGAEGKDLTPGASPSPDAPSSPPEVPKLPCPPGQLPGTATYGNTTVTVCTPAPVTQADKPKETVKQNAGTPQETTTEKEAETKCIGEECTTTTTTTTKDASGTTTGVTVTVETGTKAGICEKNPKDRICTGGTAGDCPEGASSIGCMKVGTPEDGEVPSEEVNVGTITPDNMAGFNIGHACPPDLTVDVFGKTHHFEFKPLCDAAPMIKPIVMLLAAFAALGIVYAALVGNA